MEAGVTSDADEIRQEIDDTREELGETLEAIGARVAPGHVAQRVRDDVDDKLDKVSPARVLRRRTEGLRTSLRRVAESGAVDAGAAVADSGGTAAVGDRLRRMCSTAVDEVSSAPPPAQALAAFGGGLAFTAILPRFARRRSTALLLGAAVAAYAFSRLGK